MYTSFEQDYITADLVRQLPGMALYDLDSSPSAAGDSCTLHRTLWSTPKHTGQASIEPQHHANTFHGTVQWMRVARQRCMRCEAKDARQLCCLTSTARERAERCSSHSTL